MPEPRSKWLCRCVPLRKLQVRPGGLLSPGQVPVNIRSHLSLLGLKLAVKPGTRVWGDMGGLGPRRSLWEGRGTIRGLNRVLKKDVKSKSSQVPS